MNAKRTLSFEEAIAIGDSRFTLTHIPPWYATSARRHGVEDKYFAPQFSSDREWYENTKFRGEEGHYGGERNYHSINFSFPLGVWLDKPYELPNKPCQRVRLEETHKKRNRVRL